MKHRRTLRGILGTAGGQLDANITTLLLEVVRMLESGQGDEGAIAETVP
jgi:hypothetical protein